MFTEALFIIAKTGINPDDLKQVSDKTNCDTYVAEHATQQQKGRNY